MSEKGHNLGHAPRDASGRQAWPVDQDHRHPEATRGVEFRPCAGATGVFGNDEIDTSGFQKLPVALLAERATRDDRLGIRQRQLALRRVDEPEDVTVPGLRGESAKVLATDGKEDAGGFLWQSRDGSGEVGDVGPVVVVACLPRRALIGAKRRSRVFASRNRVPTHLCCEGMGRIHYMGYVFGPKKGGKALRAAETADARRQGLFDGCVGAPGIGKDRIHPVGGKVAGELARLAGAAEKKDACHG